MSNVMTPHDRSDEPVLVEKSNVENEGVKQTIKHMYVPPLDGTADELMAFDMKIARAVAEVLVTNYPGYSWLVTADSHQGVVYFRIPELMGPTLNYLINLGDFSDLTPKLIMVCGGELLERMGLRRGAIDLSEYFSAKNNKAKFDFADVRSGAA